MNDFNRLKRWETPRSGPTRATKGKRRPQAIRSRRKARQTLLNRLQGRPANGRFFIASRHYGKSGMTPVQYAGHMGHILHSSYVPYCIHYTIQEPFQNSPRNWWLHLFHRSFLDVSCRTTGALLKSVYLASQHEIVSYQGSVPEKFWNFTRWYSLLRYQDSGCILRADQCWICIEATVI